MDRQELNKIIGLTIDEAKKKVPEGYLLCPFCVKGYAYIKNLNKEFKIISIELSSNIITKAYFL
jgi:hypothetical protein